jgi:hypothetical protein
MLQSLHHDGHLLPQRAQLGLDVAPVGGAEGQVRVAAAIQGGDEPSLDKRNSDNNSN